VETQAEMLCRFRLDGTILFVNKAYASMLDTHPDLLMKSSFWDFVPDEEHAEIRAVLESLTPDSPQGRLENRLETPGGTLWTMWTNRASSFDGEGRPVEFQSTGIDITERRAAEEALRRADQRKNEFLAVLGHELRNPLAPIRAGIDLLQTLGGGDETGKRTLAMIGRQVDHLVYLVDDLLDLSRISRGRIALRRCLLDLREPIEDAIALARPTIDENRQRLSYVLPPEPVSVNGDRDRLAQVFGNLLNNAAKYSDPGGTISLSMSIEGSLAVVRIRDTGFGIPAEHLKNIFEIFEQIPEHHSSPGSSGLGIGLSISRDLIAIHDGSIEASSDGLGCGSEFTVRLPVSDAAIVPCMSQRNVDEAATPRRILLVDDNHAAADSLRLLLERHGHHVAVATDALTALESADAFDPEVVILDIGLPDLDGYEVARRIRAKPGGAGRLLLAVTGRGQEDDKQLARAAGFDRHLTKPVDSTYLTTLIGASA
jgi:PAS domain S-box-containing protein